MKNGHLFGALLSAVAISLLSWAFAASTLGWIEIEGAPLERPAPLAFLAGPDAKRTLRDLVAQIDTAAARDDINGVVIRLREPKLNTAQAQELGAAMTSLRKAGKKVHLFTEIYGPTELLLGSYADEVIMQTGGAASLPGLYMEEMFLADTLNWAGVKPDFVQIGDYKGASEQFMNSAPSKAWDENISQLLDSMYAGLRRQIKSGRNLTDAQLDAALEEGWLASGEQAIRLGLIDAEVDRLELDAHLEQKYGEFEYETDLGPASSESAADMTNPFALLRMLTEPPSQRIWRDTIALVHIDGAIIDGESKEAGMLGGSSVGSLTIRQALKEIEDEDHIKGVILRIESPGGSAIASESIWLGVRSVAKVKPVWVSVGSMAASGGYYIAVSGDRIYVNPASIVGSIGVVGGKFALGGVYQTLRVHVVPRARGPRADLFSSIQPWDETQRTLIASRMKETYDLFVKRVQAGRSGIDISTTAEGRLFTGDKAIGNKMADKIGGVDVALTDLAAELRLESGKYDVASFPAPKSLAEMLESALGRFMPGGASADAPGSALLAQFAAAVHAAVGDRSWPAVRDALNALTLLRTEPIILVAPRALIFR